MNNSVLLKVLSISAVVCILLAVCIFFYVESDLKRFDESMKDAPRTSQDTVSQKTENEKKEGFEQVTPVVPVASEPTEDQQMVSEGEDIKSTGDVIEDGWEETFISDDALLEDSIGDPATTDLEEKDEEKGGRKAAVADYNEYLLTDPEYAYERLADVFRADFGDIPEVPILVESIRKANNGPLTVDEALAWKEATLRTMPRTESESIAISMLEQQIESLRELKESELLGEEPTMITYDKITIR